MRILIIQLITLLGTHALIGRNSVGNPLYSDLEALSAPAHTSGDTIAERGISGPGSEYYADEIEVGAKIGQGIDASVYKAKIKGKPTSFALKQDYKDPSALQREFKAYKAIDGKDIGPAFEAIIADDCLDEFGLLLEFFETVPADKGSKEHAKGAVDALKRMHDLGYIHGDTASLTNVLVSNSGEVRLVDFVRSIPTVNTREKDEDLRNLKSAFSGVEFDEGYGVK